MITSGAGATTQERRDRAAMVLMLLAALGALFAFVGAIASTATASPETQVVEGWRMYGFAVFAGLFTLLALRPRHYAGVWELVIFHKAAMAMTGLMLLGGAAVGAATVALVDGILAAMTVAAYLLARGYTGWTSLRVGSARAR